MQVVCPLECLGEAAAALADKQVKVLVLHDAAIVELALSKAQRDVESLTACVSAPADPGCDAEAKVEEIKESFLQLLGGLAPKALPLTQAAPFASSEGVQAAVGAGKGHGAAVGAGGDPAGTDGGVQGQVAEPEDHGRLVEPKAPGEGAARGGTASAVGGTAGALPDGAPPKRAAEEQGTYLSAPEAGSDLQAAGRAGVGAGASAGQHGVPSVGPALEAASECGLGASPFGSFEWDAKEAALAPGQGSIQTAGAGACQRDKQGEHAMKVAPVELVKTFDLDVLDGGISTECEVAGALQVAAAAGFRTVNSKEKKQRKLLDLERSLRRPGWETDRDTEPPEVPNAEHQRAGLEWIMEQLVARAKDEALRFPELWD
ncbi:unnamed protein product [Prorocentrum cordatum]|uniref:Uncharacterized protein n=1 Tax=Prorocentrum cordatum TaxID=2364126 RepID=A0ABN9X697_9DINO|nr:unnamed protein product [Polarella glacialis]